MTQKTAKKELPACPVETTLMLIGDKWKVLILRDLLFHSLSISAFALFYLLAIPQVTRYTSFACSANRQLILPTVSRYFLSKASIGTTPHPT